LRGPPPQARGRPFCFSGRVPLFLSMLVCRRGCVGILYSTENYNIVRGRRLGKKDPSGATHFLKRLSSIPKWAYGLIFICWYGPCCLMHVVTGKWIIRRGDILTNRKRIGRIAAVAVLGLLSAVPSFAAAVKVGDTVRLSSDPNRLSGFNGGAFVATDGSYQFATLLLPIKDRAS